MPEYQYDAFISYRHLPLDKAVAKKLHTELETYHIPQSVSKATGKKKMGKVFRDEEELPLSVSLSENIEYALRTSEWLIVICTPDLLESKWCMKEIDTFIELGKRNNILLVLASGTPDTSFPPQLRTIVTEEGVKEVEPLAANIVAEDIPQTVKKLGQEKLRILAPMLGVGYDDLKRRARQRRIRITAAVTAAVVIAAAGSGIYISSNNKKKAQLLLQTQTNRIGEILEKTGALVSAGDKIPAAVQLLEAYDISESAGDLRRDEILSAMRSAASIEPFSVISTFGGQNIRILDAKASPAGDFVLGIVNNNSVARMDCITGQISYQVSVSNEQINDLKLSPDGTRFLANCDLGRSVSVWDSSDGSLVYTYMSKAGSQYQIANVFFLGDSDTLLIQDMDKFYKVSVRGGTEELIYTIGSYKGSYDPDHNFLTMAAGTSISSLITLNNDDYTGTCADVSPDGSKILISGKDGSSGVVVTDASGKVLFELADMPGLFTDTYIFSPDGSQIFCTSMYGYFGAWDAQTGTRQYLYTIGEGLAITVFSNAAYSPDSETIAFSAGSYLYVLSAADASYLFGGQLDDNNVTQALVFSGDSRYLFVRNQSLLIIDAQLGALVAYRGADFSSMYNGSLPVLSGRAVFVTQNDGSAWILSGDALMSVKQAVSMPSNMAQDRMGNGTGFANGLKGEHQLTDAFKLTAQESDLSPRLFCSYDERYAVIAYADGFLEIFDAKDAGAVSHVLSEYQTHISALSFSGDTLVTAHTSGKIIVYDLSSGSITKIYTSGSGAADVVLSPSGRHFLVVGNNKDSVDVWSCAEGFVCSLCSGEQVSSWGFTEDSSQAAAKVGNVFVTADLFPDEETLLARIRLLAGR